MPAFTPAQLAKNSAATDITPLLAVPASVTMTLPYTGKELLVITNGATPAAVTLDVGATVLGQPVQAFTPVNITANCAGLIMGPFTPETGDANGNVTVVFSNITTVKAVVVRLP